MNNKKTAADDDFFDAQVRKEIPDLDTNSEVYKNYKEKYYKDLRKELSEKHPLEKMNLKH